jgi:uncharacterized membrane protein
MVILKATSLLERHKSDIRETSKITLRTWPMLVAMSLFLFVCVFLHVWYELFEFLVIFIGLSNESNSNGCN